MEAGYGAEEQVTRRARRLARLEKEQSSAAHAGEVVDQQISRARREMRAWAQGAEGERLVAQSLSPLGRYPRR